MRFIGVYALLVLAAAAAATPKHGAVKVDFGVLRGSLPAELERFRRGTLGRREDMASMALTNEQTYYSTDLKIGSDGQEVTVLVDTGSLDLWIMSSDVECESDSDSSSYSKRRVLDLDKVYDASRNSHERLKRAENKDSFGLLVSQIFGTMAPGVETVVYSVSDPYATAIPSLPDGGSGSGSGGGSGSGSGGASCTLDGSFNTDTSDTFSANSTAPEFSIEYADGTTATGFWGTDYVSILNANISDVSFAVVNKTSSGFGVLGIGLEGLETTFSLGSQRSYTYENFPVRLKNSGIINKVAYSLYLNDDTASSGLVLFGAVDHAKYSGQLYTVPIINVYADYYDHPIRLDVALDSISFETSSSNITAVNGTMAALLDSGTTYTYLPSWALDNLASSMSGSYSLSMGLYQVSCDYSSDDAYAVFDFSGARIKVPLSDLVVSYSRSCYLTILEQSLTIGGVEYAVLGDNFLRSAYVVYDLEDYQISLAQASYSSEEDIDVILSSVPLAVSADYYSSTSLSGSTGTSEVSKLSSSQVKKSAAPQSSAPKFAMAAVVSALLCFSLV